jgi:hypothetical protein
MLGSVRLCVQKLFYRQPFLDSNQLLRCVSALALGFAAGSFGTSKSSKPLFVEKPV